MIDAGIRALGGEKDSDQKGVWVLVFKRDGGRWVEFVQLFVD